MRTRVFFIGIFLSMLFSFVMWKLFKPTNTNQLLLDYKQISMESLGEAGGILVGDYEIKLSEIDFEYKILTNGLFEGTGYSSEVQQKRLVRDSWDVLRNKILVSIIERKLMFQMLVRDRGFLVTEKALNNGCRKDWRETVKSASEIFDSLLSQTRLQERLCEQQIIDTYIKERIFPRASVSDEEVRAYYNANRADFHLPKRVKIKHIHLPDERTAKRVIHRINWRNFGARAKKHSISPESKNGGTLGPFTKEQMPPAFADAFKLRARQVSPIIKSPYGFHIIMVTKSFKEKTLAFQDVKDDIKEKLLEDRKRGKYQAWLQLALNSIDIKTKQYFEPDQEAL